MLDFLYHGNAKTLQHRKYKPPEVFEHGKWHKVADFPKDPKDGDGQPCTIFESRLPASFFKIEVEDSKNSIGENNKGFCLTTGSGSECGMFLFKMAELVSEGMIGLSEKGGE